VVTVDKSAYHHLSQTEILGDNPRSGSLMVAEYEQRNRRQTRPEPDRQRIKNMCLWANEDVKFGINDSKTCRDPCSRVFEQPAYGSGTSN